MAWLQCGGSSRQDTGSEPEEAYSLGGACAARAFRIGQKQNVVVHKFVCSGTVEEKIDALIDLKRGLSRELLDGSAEFNLTELGNDEILRLVALDLHAAMKE